jgi:tetratricopeptide (TPR) repeat protein
LRLRFGVNAFERGDKAGMKKKSKIRFGNEPKGCRQPLQTELSPMALLLTNALALHQSGRLAEAEKVYQQVLDIQSDQFDSLHHLGIILFQRGDPAAAVEQIDRALKRNPNDAAALNNRGNALLALQRFDEALASYDRALALRPAYADALCNRSAALHALRRYDEALVACDRTIASQPDYAEAHSNRGNTLRELRRYAEAVESCDRALALAPGFAEAHCNRGSALHALGRFDEALASFDRALALRPAYTDALCSRSASLHALKRYDEALAACDRTIALQPDYAQAHSNRGNTLREMRRYDEAVDACDRALALAPDFAESHCNRGSALHALQRFDEALASFDRALALQPAYADALCNRGAALHALKRYDEALAACDRAIALQPVHAQAHSNRGVVLQDLMRCQEALASYDRALALRPDFAGAHNNAALCRLLIGDYERGWRQHEWRWQTDQLASERRNFPQPLWLGSGELAGRTILLHAEQGFGDTLQFCRYVPLVAARGARVILEVQRPLQDLMRTLAGVAQVISRGELLRAFDLHCPLLSLPLALRTEVDTIPAHMPYLAAPEDKVRAWRDRLDGHEKRRIGLVWAGNPRKELANCNRIDVLRSMEFAQLAPLFEVSDCEFYSLQKGDDAVSQLRDSVLRRHVVDWTDDLHDFSDTAALIENLDLVITVDTAVAHLAGALNKPIWLLNRYNTCWRWLLDREGSPWYPTARLFRQDAGRQWDGVVARVCAALREYARS